MRIAIYTSDLTRENQHLMPWRMVVEIGNSLCQTGHRAEVLSGRRDPTGEHWVYGGCPVEEIAKPYSREGMDKLRRMLRREEFDVLFWPVAWCRDRGQVGLLRDSSIPIVWYIPGACYLLRQVVRAIPDVNWRATLPFLIQSIYPKKRLVRSLRRAAGLMITMSQFSRAAVCRAGWPAQDVFFIPPGKPVDDAPPPGEASMIFQAVQHQLCGRPFYLFLGPPANIRGIRQLFQAFHLLACQRPDVCLVCLFRSDRGTDVVNVRRRVEQGPHADRIMGVWQSVEKVDLDAFLEACHAVVLPFLLVPSEIPLAVIEAAGHRKPVITTGPGGTADFVRDFGLAVPVGHSSALSSAMLQLLNDGQLYADKCRAAARRYAAHPTWEETALSWLGVAAKAVERRKGQPDSVRPICSLSS